MIPEGLTVKSLWICGKSASLILLLGSGGTSSTVHFQPPIPFLPSDLVSSPALLARWVCTRSQEDSGTREGMVLSKKVLSQGKKWGLLRWKWIVWTLEPRLSELWALCIGGEEGFPIPSLSKCWRGLRVLLERYTDRPGGSETVHFSLAFLLGASDP